jgi:3-oxoacyl-[acyl-carrier-protein] synthase III
MNVAQLNGVTLKGLRACVPAHSRTLEDENLIHDATERDRLQKTIGVRSRHIASPGVCTSDLCQRAAENLLTELGWAKDSIDVLVLVTQSSDYVIPATACALQHRLGLGSCLAFDITLGCSGYAYGLWTAASLLKTLQVNGRPARALVLAGDVSTSKLMPGDRGTVPLFGDAGSATALETDSNAATWTGVFGTDGSGAEHIMVEAGALRKPLLPPSSPHDAATQDDLFKASRLHLNGVEVFNFTLKNVPTLIEKLLTSANTDVESVDHFVLHQANQMMLKHLAKKSGLPESKTPIAMEHYGNTSSASIPLTIADQLADSMTEARTLVMVGFGVGWSWSAIKMNTGPMPKPQVDFLL